MKRRVLKILMLLFVATILFGCGATAEDAKKQMEKQLYEKYGEEFVVNYVGSRSANGEKFYQGEIHPKSIDGTPKEKDKYYYSTASIDIKSFGRLDKYVADTYSEVKMNEEAEEYLLPKAKELFGERIRLKADIRYIRIKNGTPYHYYVSDLKGRMKEVEETPDKRRIEVNLDIYIFDKIDNEEEKEKRREEIFEYIQYLKKEKLFEYLEMGVIFIDERILAPSYANYKYKLKYGKREKEIVDGETIYLPEKKLREEMSIALEKEIEEMNEQEKLDNMNKILKSEMILGKKGLEYYNGQYYTWICSIKMLKEQHSSLYKKEKGYLNFYKYKNLENIIIGKTARKRYIYQTN